MESEYTIVMNAKSQRFEVPVGAEFGYIDYRFYKGNLAFMHTFVPDEARGKGLAAVLAKFGLEYARENNLQIMVYCPYVAAFIKKHPEYEDLKNIEFHPKK